jgi:hypothetical protein
MLGALHDGLRAVSVLLELGMNLCEGGPQIRACVGGLYLFHHVFDPRQAFAEHDRRVIYGVQRVAQLVASDVDELFLKFTISVGFGRMRALRLHGLPLEAPKIRDVVPDTYPAADGPRCVGSGLGLKVVQDLSESSSSHSYEREGRTYIDPLAFLISGPDPHLQRLTVPSLRSERIQVRRMYLFDIFWVYAVWPGLHVIFQPERRFPLPVRPSIMLVSIDSLEGTLHTKSRGLSSRCDGCQLVIAR